MSKKENHEKVAVGSKMLPVLAILQQDREKYDITQTDHPLLHQQNSGVKRRREVSLQSDNKYSKQTIYSR